MGLSPLAGYRKTQAQAIDQAQHLYFLVSSTFYTDQAQQEDKHLNDCQLIFAANIPLKVLMLDFDWFWSPQQKQ